MLLNALLISLGINILVFLVAFLRRTDKLTDITYAVTFIILSLYGLIVGGQSAAIVVLVIMIGFWALRLGSYLLIRIRKAGKDKRFDKMRGSFLKFGGFWLLQGFSIWVILLPSLLFFESYQGGLSTISYVGLVVWLVGILVESVSDLQKYRFINNPKNKGRWIESGLWKYSRHPNYFGEIFLWFGVYIFTLQGLSGASAYLGLLGPLYIAALIIFVSGIPVLEKGADKRWGSDPAYQEYKRRTSILVPRPPRKNV